MDKTNHVGDVQRSSELIQCSDVLKPNSNGYAPTAARTFTADVEDDESERAGVFDYMPQNLLLKSDSRFGFNQNSNESEDLTQDSLRHKWASDAAYNSNVECLSDKELTTFCSSTGLNRSFGSELEGSSPVSNGADLPDVATTPDESLEEIVIQTEVVPQRASYERFGADRGQRYRPANNTAPVYITDIQRSGEHKNAYWNYGDEREVVERRSSQNMQYASASMGNQYFGSSDNADESTHLIPATAATNGPDSPLSAASANDDSITTAAVQRQFGSMIYLNDIPMWARTAGGLVSSADVSVEDGSSSSRYYSSNGSRSDTARRLRYKLEKKRSHQLANGIEVSRSQDSTEHKDKSVEELLAFINNMKIDDEAHKTKSTLISSTSKGTSGRDKAGVRKKKKQLPTSEIADANADGSNMALARTIEDPSVSSGSEAPDRYTNTVGKSATRRCEVSSSEVITQSNVVTDVSSDEVGLAQHDRDQFVVVQKKKKTKQMLSSSVSTRLINADDGRQKSKTFTSSYAARSAFSRPNDAIRSSDNNVTVSYKNNEVDSTSWTSDSESTTSSLVREQATINGIQLCGNDFPDLLVDRSSVVNARRNSTGTVSSVEKLDKIVVAQSFATSYAIVAAVGLASNANDVNERGKSLEFQGTSSAVDNDSVDKLLSDTSKFLSGNDNDVSGFEVSSATMNGHSGMNSCRDSVALVNRGNAVTFQEVSRVYMSPVDCKLNESRVSIGSNKNAVLPICTVNPESNTADVSVSSASIKRRNTVNSGVKITSSTELPVVAQTAVVYSTSARSSSIAEKKSKCPVVFMDIGSDSVSQPSASTASIGISFGFDDVEVSSTSVSIDIRNSQTSVPASVLPTCARCTVYSTDKVSANVATSTDSATSPIEQHDFVCGHHGKSGVIGWTSTSHHVTGYCRPLVPHSASHLVVSPPVGIVPPIQHVDRTQTTDAIDYSDPKSLLTEHNIMTAECLNDEVQKCTLSEDIQFINESSANSSMVKPALSSVQNQSATCSVTVSENPPNRQQSGSFCLLSAQIFLYKGFEDTLAEQSQNPDQVHQFVIDA